LERLKREGDKFNWLNNEKSGKLQFTMIDRTSKNVYRVSIENLHKSLVSHSKVKYDNYSRLIPRD
jgi:hypothetical protein